MQKTSAALEALCEHWQNEGCPSATKIAKKANVSPATANRYLTGVTKLGTPETIRALAIAMDRRDIAESIPSTKLGGNEHAEAYIAELHKQWDEAAQQRLTEAEARHAQELEKLRSDHNEERKTWSDQLKALRNQTLLLSVEKWIFAILFATSIILHHK